MAGDRTETAVQRIEAALARIARVADAPPQVRSVGEDGADQPASSANVLALVEKHEALRETVAHTLSELDAVIAELEQ